jgi:hypothetical protein
MPKTIELELLCDLSDEEVRLKSQAVGEAVVEQQRLESAKRDATKEYGEQITEVKQRMLALSKQVRTKTEKRMVACQVDFHVPQISFKRTTRLDTGEVVREEPMTEDERQQRMFEGREEPAQPSLTLEEELDGPKPIGGDEQDEER